MTTKLLIATIAGMLACPAFAAAPFEKGKSAPRQLNQSPKPMAKAGEQTLINEDFSKFTGGTEDTPGDEITYENGYHIPESLTLTPGWTGGGIFPTAGSIALMDRAGLNQLGFISTPALNLGGTAILTFRARILPGSESGSLWVALCDDYDGPGDDQADFKLTSEWTEYTLTATNGSLEEPSYFQLQAENGYVQLDDIRIDFKRDRLPSPYPLRAINNSPTEFTARWEDCGVSTYRLNVVCVETPENPVQGSLIETFDNINIAADGTSIDAASPNYPEGWEFDLSGKGDSDVCTEEGKYLSAPLSLHFDAVGDMITSPQTPEPLECIKFWVRPSSTDEDEETLSLLRVEIYHSLTGKWEAIAHLPYYWMQEQGGFYTLERDALGDDSTRVRFSFIQKGKITFYLDDVILTYRSRGKTFKFIEDLDVEGTEHKVSDINPQNEYTYYVQAVDGDLVSEPSYTIWVDGVEGLKPTVLEPTDITKSSFVANWQPLGHATDYSVETSLIVRAESDMEGVLVNEETFDDINDSGYDWQSPLNFADKGMAQTGWSATQPQWKPGMAGTQGTSWIGMAGLVFSPYLDLSCNNNEGFHVEATVETTSAGIQIEDGTTIPEGMFVMVLNSPNDTQALCSAYFDTPQPGSHSAKVFVANPDNVDLSNVIVAFMNTTGTAFYVDNVKITQDLRAGEVLMAPYAVEKTSGTNLAVDVIPGQDYAYTVTASVMKNYENYISEKSDAMTVHTSTVGVDEISGATGGITVASGRGTLSVNAPEDTAYTVYALDGSVAASGSGANTFSLAAGVYVVKSADKAIKTIVR